MRRQKGRVQNGQSDGKREAAGGSGRESVRDMGLKLSERGVESKGGGDLARKRRCRQQEGALSEEYFTPSIISQAQNLREARKKLLDLEEQCINF